jgi:hypothetical protein
MILLFLLQAVCITDSSGFIYSIHEKAITTKSKDVFIVSIPDSVAKSSEKYFYDRGNKRYSLKPPMKVSFAKDTINIEQTNIKTVTEITVYEKFSQASLTPPKQVVYDKTSTGKVKTKQSWTVGSISVVNKLCYPMRVDFEVSK